jgi:hypothetical protein
MGLLTRKINGSWVCYFDSAFYPFGNSLKMTVEATDSPRRKDVHHGTDVNVCFVFDVYVPIRH